VKIAVVTPYFPTSHNPHDGQSAIHTLRCLLRYAEIEVICPITSYPRWLRPSRYHGLPDPSYQPAEFRTTYLPYPAISVITRGINGLTCARLLLPYIRSLQPDIILNYWVYPEGFSALRVGQKLGIPVIIGAIGSDICRIRDRCTRYLTRWTLQNAAGVITVSEDLRRRVLDLGASAEKVTSIRNGVDTSVFYVGDRIQTRQALGLNPGEEIILYVGRLHESKGLGELLEAFIKLSKSRPASKFVIIGAGPYNPALVRAVTSARIHHCVRLLGPQDSSVVSQWMRAADIFCLPSHSEGCPNVIVEALSCGCPVVATDVGGIPELVGAASGILVHPHSSTELCSALEAALMTSWERNSIARANLRTWDQVARETLAACYGAVRRSHR
jgi:teichuronic acid biosynthesis glycosyltransferase TuaC